MLNNAFVSMKDENSFKWLNKVEDLLRIIELREVWLSPHQWEKKSFKSLVTQRLCDISFQK